MGREKLKCLIQRPVYIYTGQLLQSWIMIKQITELFLSNYKKCVVREAMIWLETLKYLKPHFHDDDRARTGLVKSCTTYNFA